MAQKNVHMHKAAHLLGQMTGSPSELLIPAEHEVLRTQKVQPEPDI